MSNAGPLDNRPKTELANLARRRGIRGWETMNKGDLLKVLSRGATTTKSKPAKTVKPTKPAKTAARPARVTVKTAAKVTAKRPVKSAAKLTKPTALAKHTKPTPRPAARTGVNGTHRPAPSTNGSPKSAQKPTGKPAAPSASKAALPVGKSSGSKTAPAASPPPAAIKARRPDCRGRRRRTASSWRSSSRTGCTSCGICPHIRSSARSSIEAGLVRRAIDYPPFRRDQSRHHKHVRDAAPGHPDR